MSQAAPAETLKSPDTGSEYAPETPFAPDAELERGTAFETLPAEGDSNVVESPFPSQYVGDEELQTPEAELFQELVKEVFDEEFDYAVDALIGELSEVYEQRFAHEDPTPGGRLAAERQLESFIEPLQHEALAMLERMAAGTEGVEIDGLTDAELDELLDPFEPEVDLPSPAMEEFLGKLFKKAKNAVKKVVRKAKKVAKTVAGIAGKFLPHNLLLRKLRKLVKPLLQRVLRFAINRVPKRFRPLARQLSHKFLKISAETGSQAEEFAFLEEGLVQGGLQLEDPDAASPDSSVIQAEFDALLVAEVLEGEDLESSAEFLAYVAEDEVDEDDPIGELELARERFVRELEGLEDGDDPTPVVENFVAAVLPALRVGIKIIGRKRVVNFLAKLVARLIGRFVGRRNARPLSRALVDAGLGLLRLETPEAEAEGASAELLAATVEETFERLAADAPEEAFDDEAVLETYVTDAFESAVAANFPEALVRRDLRSGRTGAWQTAPRQRVRRYKRYTRVFEIELTPAVAKRVQSFAGQTLASALSEELGVPIDRGPVKARLHVYEALRGTRLSHIARSEGRRGGATAAGRGSARVLHPLTCAAAGLLLPGEPGLCRDVPARFLRDRRRIKVGQRFYALEIPGARLRAASGPSTRTRARTAPAARASEVRVTLDLRRRRLVIHDFLSEATAQGVAAKLRRGASFAAVARLLRASLGAGVKTALSGQPTSQLRLVREVGTERELPAAIAGILRLGGDRLGAAVASALELELTKLLKSRFEAFSKDFVRAAEADADGVTLVLTVQAGALFEVLLAPLAGLPSRLASLRRRKVVDSVDLDVKEGHAA